MRQYKVRLEDGSDISLDLQAVKDWYTQGLLKRDSPVLKPGAKQWLPLAQALDLPSAKRRAAAEAAAADEVAEAESVAAEVPRWRSALAAVLLVVAAAGAGYFWWHPERWLAELDPTPWRDLALGLLAAALLLAPGWKWGRRIVRVLALPAALAAFPLAVVLVLKGVPFGPPYFVLGAAFLLLVGYFMLLSGSESWLTVVLSLLLILGGGYAVGRFGLVVESEEDARVRQALVADAEPTLRDPELGTTVELRQGWRRLRRDQQAVAVPSVARFVLALPRRGGFAYLTAETAPRGIVSVDDYLERVLTQRRQTLAELANAGRHDVAIGGLTGRGATVHRQAAGRRVRDETAVWRSGWTWFALVAWVPDDGNPAAARPISALHAGFAIAPARAREFSQAVDAVTRDAPLLSPAAAEHLVRASAPPAMNAEQAVKRAFRLVSLGLPALPPEEAAELTALTSASYASAPAKEKARIAEYLDRLRADQATSADEDRAMAPILKRGLLELPSGSLARLQDLYAKAIMAGLRV